MHEAKLVDYLIAMESGIENSLINDSQVMYWINLELLHLRINGVDTKMWVGGNRSKFNIVSADYSRPVTVISKLKLCFLDLLNN